MSFIDTVQDSLDSRMRGNDEGKILASDSLARDLPRSSEPSRIPTMHRLLTVAISIAVASGCSTHRDPTISVVGATITNVSDEAMAVQIALEVTNPNDVSLRLDEFEYSLTYNGVQAFSGIRSAEATLASHDVRQMVVPAVVPRSAAPEASPGGEFAISGSLSYIRPGEISRMFRDMGFPNPKAPIVGGGDVRAFE